MTRTAPALSALPSEAPIGVFDSGLGGLTVVRQIRRVLPHEDLIYLGDTARVPYGTKSPGTVTRYTLEAAQFLASRGVKAMVIACNTASAWALVSVRKNLPIPLLGVVEPGVQAALKATPRGRIGVIATSATIRSNAYQGALTRKGGRRIEVLAKACPLLVPLVEEGWHRHAVTEQVLEEYLGPWKSKHLNTLVLGCTHYPLLKRAIRRVMGPRVRLVDSAATCAHAVAHALQERHLLASSRRRQGRLQAFITDEEPRFATAASQLLRIPKVHVRVISLDPIQCRAS